MNCVQVGCMVEDSFNVIYWYNARLRTDLVGFMYIDQWLGNHVEVIASNCISSCCTIHRPTLNVKKITNAVCVFLLCSDMLLLIGRTADFGRWFSVAQWSDASRRACAVALFFLSNNSDVEVTGSLLPVHCVLLHVPFACFSLQTR
jgi:hypothetical protein